MEITTPIYLEANTTNTNNDAKVYVSFDIEPTKEDLNEFAVEQGYKDLRDYFNDYFDDDEKDIMNEILEDLDNGHSFEAELHIDCVCKDKQNLHDFLLRKYEKQILSEFMRHLTDYSESERFEFAE